MLFQLHGRSGPINLCFFFTKFSLHKSGRQMEFGGGNSGMKISSAAFNQSCTTFITNVSAAFVKTALVPVLSQSLKDFSIKLSSRSLISTSKNGAKVV